MSISDEDREAVLGLLERSDPAGGGPDPAARERIREGADRLAHAERPGPRRWWPQLLQAGAVAALCAVAFAVLILPQRGTETQPAQDPAETQDGMTDPAAAPLAVQAAKQPPLEGVIHLRWERDLEPANSFDTLSEIWVGPEQRYELQRSRIGERPNGSVQLFYDRAAGISCANVPPDCDLPQPASTELPADPDELRARLVDEIDAALANGNRATGPSLVPEPGVSGLTDPRSLEQLGNLERTEFVSEELFARIVSLLADPQAAPDVRAAAFTVLGGIEGIDGLGAFEDRLGRPGTVIEFHPPGRSPEWASYRLFIDPVSTRVLELSSDEAEPPFSETLSTPEPVDSFPPEADPFLERAAEQAG